MFDKHKKNIIEFVKQALENQPLADDIGDYIPFFAYLKEYDFCNRQLELVMNETKNNMVTGSAYPSLRFLNKFVISPELNTDVLLGLIEYFRISGNGNSFEYAENFVDSLEKYFLKDDHIHSLFFHDIKFNFPFCRGMNGMYIELLADLFEMTNNDRYLELAERIASKYTSNDFFKKNWLFPSSYFPNSPFLNSRWSQAKQVKIFKHNTSIINGLIALYEQTKNEKIKSAICKWIHSLQKNMIDEVPYGIFYPETGLKHSRQLLYAFPVIDILCDFYNISHDSELIELAKNMAHKWIAKQSDISLLPLDYDKPFQTMIDATTDFSMSLCRIAELTNKNHYRKKAIEYAEANMEHHLCYPNSTYFDFIDCKKTLLPAYLDEVNYLDANRTKYRIKAKFIALLLKPVIYLNSDKKIYKDQIMYKLMRDR